MAELDDDSVPADASALLQERGLCGAISSDGERACMLDRAHPPPCGWEQPARLRRLEPGVYVDDADAGTLHIDLPELARAHGYDPTPENIATLERAARAIFTGQGLEVEIRP